MLAEKRFETIPDNIDGATEAKTGVIVSEPFREPAKKGTNGWVLRDATTCVAVLWDNGSMEGAVDIELIKIVEEEPDEDGHYVVCVSWLNGREYVNQTPLECSSLKEAREHMKSQYLIGAKTRIAKLAFIKE